MPPKVLSKPKERVYIQLKRIRENNSLTNKQKAQAILSIKQEDVVWSDDNMELPLARRWAIDELNGNNKNFIDLASVWYHDFKESSAGKTLTEWYNKLTDKKQLAKK